MISFYRYYVLSLSRYIVITLLRCFDIFMSSLKLQLSGFLLIPCICEECYEVRDVAESLLGLRGNLLVL